MYPFPFFPFLVPNSVNSVIPLNPNGSLEV